MSTAFDAAFGRIHRDMLQVAGVTGTGKSKPVCRSRDLDEIQVYVLGILMVKPIQVVANQRLWLCTFPLGCGSRWKGSWWDHYDDRQWASKWFIVGDGVACRIEGMRIFFVCILLLRNAFSLFVGVREWRVMVWVAHGWQLSGPCFCCYLSNQDRTIPAIMDDASADGCAGQNRTIPH